MLITEPTRAGRRAEAAPTFGCCAFILLCCFASCFAEDKMGIGDSEIAREGVTYALHVPKTADEPHGLLATLIFFGGYGDGADAYQKALGTVSDDLDFVLVVPHMPWFRELGKVDEEQILDSLNQLKT